ncbi:MAG: rod shape-determining protein MreC [Neisseriaceae bacterium]|nr:rod shape-determining protein MreC [Neisseriaceae bacterium]
MNQESLSFIKGGLQPITKFILLGLLSLSLLIADSSLHITERTRNHLLTASAPIQRVLQLPQIWWQYTREFVTHQNYLITANDNLSRQNTLLSAQVSRSQDLLRENEELKQLLNLTKNGVKPVTSAQVISTGRDIVAVRFTLDKGSEDGVSTGQAVIDGHGLIGQITAVSPNNSQMTLLKHQKTIIPVMVARTGYRTLIYGDTTHLDLRYFPLEEDLHAGDILLTSGIDSHYPAGIPVARVIRLETAAGTPYYRTVVQDFGSAQTIRYVLILPHNRPQEVIDDSLPETKIKNKG